MTTWALDSNGDWTFNNNVFTPLNGNFEIVQNVETRIKEQVNDCFFNQFAGIDWINLPTTQSQIDDLVVNIKNIVAGTNGVTGIEDIQATLDSRTRQLTVVVSYKTIYSDSEVSQFLFDA